MPTCFTRPLSHGSATSARSDPFVRGLGSPGFPFFGLAFLAWTCIYLALWAVHPDEAFRGLPAEPRFPAFFHYAVSTGFVSRPSS